MDENGNFEVFKGYFNQYDEREGPGIDQFSNGYIVIAEFKAGCSNISC
jgi:hypothetical protein